MPHFCAACSDVRYSKLSPPSHNAPRLFLNCIRFNAWFSRACPWKIPPVRFFPACTGGHTPAPDAQKQKNPPAGPAGGFFWLRRQDLNLRPSGLLRCPAQPAAVGAALALPTAAPKNPPCTRRRRRSDFLPNEPARRPHNPAPEPQPPPFPANKETAVPLDGCFSLVAEAGFEPTTFGL